MSETLREKLLSIRERLTGDGSIERCVYELDELLLSLRASPAPDALRELLTACKWLLDNVGMITEGSSAIDDATWANRCDKVLRDIDAALRSGEPEPKCSECNDTGVVPVMSDEIPGLQVAESACVCGQSALRSGDGCDCGRDVDWDGHQIHYPPCPYAEQKPTGDGWTRVEDGLPEPSTFVQIYCSDNECQYTAIWDARHGVWEYAGPGIVTRVHHEITHWRPLPPAPEDR